MYRAPGSARPKSSETFKSVCECGLYGYPGYGRKEETSMFNTRPMHGQDGSPQIRTCETLFVRTGNTLFFKKRAKIQSKMDMCGQIGVPDIRTQKLTKIRT